MSRYVVLGASLMALGWSIPDSSPLSELLPPGTVRARVLAVAADGSRKEVLQEVKTASFPGDYHLGAGIYDLHLVLKDDGTYACTWRGCVGIYGEASGRWSLEATGLKLSARNADGMLKKHPVDTLLIITLENHFLLLRNQDRDWFDKRGPDAFACFHKEEARKLLRGSELGMRRLQAEPLFEITP